MSLIIIIFGIAICLAAIVTTVISDKKTARGIIEFSKLESELRTLKREVEADIQELNSISKNKLDELEVKIKDINRAGTLVDSKIKEGKSIVKILENTLEKSENIEVNSNNNFRSSDLTKIQILDLYKKGMSIKDIALKTGKSLEELKYIMEI